MIVISFIFLTFVIINIISTKTNNIDEYMKEIEKELREELKIIK